MKLLHIIVHANVFITLLSFIVHFLGRFIFDLLDHAAMGDEALDQFEFNAFMGKDNHKGLGTTIKSDGTIRDNMRQSSKKAETLVDEKKKTSRGQPKNAGAKGFGSKK